METVFQGWHEVLGFLKSLGSASNRFAGLC